MANLRVKFNDTEYWFMGDSLKEDGPISEIDRCDEDGNPLDYFSESYAYYFPNQGVLRYREKICDVKNVKLI